MTAASCGKDIESANHSEITQFPEENVPIQRLQLLIRIHFAISFPKCCSSMPDSFAKGTNMKNFSEIIELVRRTRTMVFDILRYQWRSCPIPNVDTRPNGLHCNDWWQDHHGYAFRLAMPVITGPLHTMLIQSCNCYCNASPLATCTVITFACARALLVR